MLNPNNSDGSYGNLLKEITQRVKQEKAEDQILALLQQAVEKELSRQSVVLSKPERIRLFHQVTKTILNNVLENIK
jgi:anti-sigma factor ChrR (cupin superfamily)